MARPIKFFDLPGELRNMIYKFSFTTDDVGDTEGHFINLAHTHPPSKSLLLASRQFKSEARGFYRTAYQDYWSKNHFVVHAWSPRPIQGHARDLFNVNWEDIGHITLLKIMLWRAETHVRDVEYMRTTEDLDGYRVEPSIIWTMVGSGSWDHVYIVPYCERVIVLPGGGIGRTRIWPRSERKRQRTLVWTADYRIIGGHPSLIYRIRGHPSLIYQIAHIMFKRG